MQGDSGFFVAAFDTVPLQLQIEPLTAETQELRGRCPIVSADRKCSFDTETLDELGRLANELFERHTAHELAKLVDRARHHGRYRRRPTRRSEDGRDRTNREPEAWVLRIERRHCRHLRFGRGAKISANDGGKASYDTVLAKIGEHDLHIDAGSPDPAIEPLPDDLTLVGLLRDLAECRVRAQNSAVVTGHHEPIGPRIDHRQQAR